MCVRIIRYVPLRFAPWFARLMIVEERAWRLLRGRERKRTPIQNPLAEAEKPPTAHSD
jgi:hypothetical protein